MSASSFDEAREQACEKLGFLRSKTVTIGKQTFEVPNPSLLSHEQQKRYNALQLFVQESDELDRYKGTEDENGNTFKGNPKVPWRNKAGELIEEDYDYRLAKAIFGEQFEAFLAAGGNPSDIGLIWAEMNQHVADRARDDSKSDDGDRRLAAVPDSN